MRIVKDKKYKNMYRVKWPDGTMSVSTPHPDKKDGHYGFYNKSRAKEFLRRGDIENYTLGVSYNSPMARLEAHG